MILTQVRRLFKDFSFLLKVLEMIVAGVCVNELLNRKEFTVPRWLWVIYSIDASTYFIIYFSIAMTHVFEKARRLPEFTFFSLGVILHLIGAIAGLARSQYDDSEDSEVPRNELKIGLLLLANCVILFCEAAHIAYTEYPKMSACMIGTVVYMRPLEPYIEAPIFGILVPTFITGYMLIHSSDILLLAMRKDYMFLETWFVVIGAVGSLTCGIYQFYKWIEWVVNTSPEPNGDNNIPELVLALAFLLHFVCLCAVMTHRILELYRTRIDRGQL